MAIKMLLLRYIGAFTLFVVLASYASKSEAGPTFCLNAPGMQPQCIFYSADACREKTSKISQGFCSVNPDELTVPSGPRLWCLVTSDRLKECFYDNLRSCEQSARTKNAICVRTDKNTATKYIPRQGLPAL